MKKGILKKINQRGSLMVEALALLGLITMVTPILYKKAAERTTELQDINVATQMRIISGAVDDYIKDNYRNMRTDVDKFELNEDQKEALMRYMPHGFDLQYSKLFENFDIGVRREEVTYGPAGSEKTRNVYTAAVLAPLKDANFSRGRAAKIATMIGANGGMLDTEWNAEQVEGAQGSWFVAPSDYDLDIGAATRALAVISSEAIASARGDVGSDEVLYRIDAGGDGKNTMQTTLYMDGNDIQTMHNLIAKTGTGSNDFVDVVEGKDASDRQIVIGRRDADNMVTDLFVTGSANIAKNFRVRGDSQFDGNVTVKGDTTLEKNLTVKGDTTLEKLDVNGKATFNDNVIMQKNLSVAGDLNVNGSTTLNDLTVNGKAEFNNDVTINGDLILPEGDLIGDYLYARKGLKIGGTGTKSVSGEYFEVGSEGMKLKRGTMNILDNLIVDSDEMQLTKGMMNILGNLVVNEGAVDVRENFIVQQALSGMKIKALRDEAAIGYDVNSSDYKGFVSKSGEQILRQGDGNYLRLKGGAELKASEDTGLVLQGDTAVLKAKSVGLELEGKDAGIGWNIKTADKSTVAVDNDGNFSVDVGNVASGGLGMKLNNYGLSLSFGGDGSGAVTEAEEGNSILDGNAKVAISRNGVIELASPSEGKGHSEGYIRARRLVSDVAYPAELRDQADAQGSSRYDYYQVNPAYTSVMNDIKLASRGGARLSDILPDYVNKEIYIVDNTYKSELVDENDWGAGRRGWADAHSLSEIKILEETVPCENNNCIASPWMGYVPAPQCPPNYAKAVAINPIRWRMSEVYTVIGTGGWSTFDGDDYKEAIGENFNTHFQKYTHPKLAEFKLGDADGSVGIHEHYLESGRPMTFQTNTWLNTTIEDVMDGSEFAGWSAIMGFLYRPTQYSSLLSDLGETATDSVWNIFPVYAEEMAAIANVYCFFERYNRYSGSEWTWGNGADNPVYKYDQLRAYKGGYDRRYKEDKEEHRASSWVTQVNDPDLDYDEPW